MTETAAFCHPVFIMSIGDWTDEEVVEMVLEQLEEDGRIQTEHIRVECADGHVSISGRVAADEEIEIVNEIFNDVLDIHEYENHLWVDDTLAFEEGEEDEEKERPELEEEEEPEEESPLDDEEEEE